MFLSLRRSSGATLTELMLTVTVTGTAASIAAPHYINATEIARSAEAIITISSIRTAENLYKLETGRYTADLGELLVRVPAPASEACWAYSIKNASTDGFSVVATRSQKKTSGDAAGKTIIFTWNDIAAEQWLGTHPGVPR